MTAWYARGELGEAIRDLMDAFLDDFIDTNTMIETLSEMGLSLEEMMEVCNEELELQQATFH
jgi:hypothetical protein